MKLTVRGAIMRHRFLHLSQLRSRILILTDNYFQPVLTHPRGCQLRLAYRPALRRGCCLLNDCVKLGDGTSVQALALCGSRRNLLVSLPVKREAEATEIAVLRLFHDEKLPILQVIESANEIAATLAGLSPTLLVRVDRPLNVILSGCNRLLGTINRLSDGAASALGGQFVQYRREDLVRHVRAICIGAMPLALESGINLRYRSNVPRLEAMVDPEFVTRIMENLLSNAIRYTPRGGHVWVRVDMMGDGWLRLSVADNGEGVPDEIRGRLFERFVTGRGNARAGAGLGLYNVRMFAEKMGGRVHCASAPGQGARFDVDLPVASGAPSNAPDSLAYCPDAHAL